MSELVQLSEIEIEKQRILLPKGKYYPPRVGPTYQRIFDGNASDLLDVVESTRKSTYLVVDLETRGNDYSLELAHSEDGITSITDSGEEVTYPTTEVVGMGLAWDAGSIYFDWNALNYYSQKILLILLDSHSGLVAHNVYFDGGYLNALMGKTLPWRYCTYATLAFLATEAHQPSGWGLKDAMVEFLGWRETNEEDLDRWLVVNGYYVGTKRKDESREYLESEYTKWKASQGTGKKQGLSPRKGDMWRAPTPILGKYCLLDVEATYLLLTKILLPTLSKFPSVEAYLSDYFMPHILKHIEQKVRGVQVDTIKLASVLEAEQVKLGEIYQYFVSMPEVSEHIREVEFGLRYKALTPEPSRLKKCKVTDPGPPTFKKNGEINLTWKKKKVIFDAHDCEKDCVSKTWLNWKEKVRSTLEDDLPEFRLNLNSDPQMIELLYEKLGFPVEISTEAGQPSLTTTAYAKMGAVGLVLTDYSDCSKKISFLTKYTELTEHRDTIHASFRLPGAATTRLTSSEPNVHQIAKDRDIMGLFQAREGNLLVDLDFSAVESVIAAELSGDINLKFLFEDPTRLNDSHLFLGAHIPGEIGEKIKASGYDPFNPTPETIANAKKMCKRERQICKTTNYLLQFGGGRNRLKASLEEGGVYLSSEEVDVVYDTYWNLFKTLREYSKDLFFEWKKNGGWISNGMGLPMSILPSDTKDLVSRAVQSTGAALLVTYTRILEKTLDSSGIEWYPYIWNLHDATTIEVRERDAELASKIFADALQELNNMIRGDLNITGKAMVGKTLCDVKEVE